MPPTKQVFVHGLLLQRLFAAAANPAKAQRWLLASVEQVAGAGPHADVLLKKTAAVLKAPALAYARTPEAQEEVAHPKPVPLTAEEAVAQAAAEGLKLEPSYRCASGYRGVKVDGSRYHARAMRDGKNVHLGSFSTAEEAALAVARAVACTDSSPRLAAVKRATQPPKPPPAKQPRSSLVPGALPSVSGCRDGVAVEEAEPLLAFIGLVVHKQFEGTLARTHTACDVPHAQ